LYQGKVLLPSPLFLFLLFCFINYHEIPLFETYCFPLALFDTLIRSFTPHVWHCPSTHSKVGLILHNVAFITVYLAARISPSRTFLSPSKASSTFTQSLQMH
jgi:hypothetical protein